MVVACENRLAGASEVSVNAFIAGVSNFLAEESSSSFSSKINWPIVQQSSASISAAILISESCSHVAKGSSKA